MSCLECKDLLTKPITMSITSCFIRGSINQMTIKEKNLEDYDQANDIGKTGNWLAIIKKSVLGQMFGVFSTSMIFVCLHSTDILTEMMVGPKQHCFLPTYETLMT